MASSSERVDAGEKDKGEKGGGVNYRTTLSTSTSSFEALDPHDPQLNRLASVAFSGEIFISLLYSYQHGTGLKTVIT